MKKININGLEIGIVKNSEIMDSDYIVVSLQEDFDIASNTNWEIEGNKSFPRDLVCGKCKEPVVMSNNTFSAYLKAPKPDKIICMRCLLEVMKKK